MSKQLLLLHMYKVTSNYSHKVSQNGHNENTKYFHCIDIKLHYEQHNNHNNILLLKTKGLKIFCSLNATVANTYKCKWQQQQQEQKTTTICTQKTKGQ